MPVETLLNLVSVLARAQFDGVLGTAESSWVDFKRAPYGLDTDRSRWELAKDVSAFANTAAGAIIIGFETTTDEASRVESAFVRRPTTLEALKLQAIRNVVRDWIYPRVRQFEIEWYPDSADSDLGYALLYIPGQEEADMPFVVRRMSNGEEKGSVGIAERDGADTAWWGAERIHHRLQRHDEPASAGPAGTPVSTESIERRLDDHLLRNEVMQEWEREPILHLQAIPPHLGRRLPNFYNRDGFRGVLNEPPSLRSGGWSLRTSFEPEVDEGALVCRSRSTDVLRLEPDGLFTVSGIADDGFLCWAMGQGRDPDEPLSLNPIAIAEWIYSFFMFVNEELKQYIVGQWTYRIVALRFQYGSIGLFGGTPGRMFRPTPSMASSDRWIQMFPDAEDIRGRGNLGFGDLSIGHEAFMGLEHLYGLFGLGNDVIPFSQGGELVLTGEILNSL